MHNIPLHAIYLPKEINFAMRWALVAAALVGGACARSLSYYMKAYEATACFYAYVDPRVDFSSATLQFYFASSDAKGSQPSFLDVTVTGPNGVDVHTQSRQKHAEVNVRPNAGGSYKMCVSHPRDKGEPNVFDKIVDVDITLPPVPDAASSGAVLDEATRKLNSTLSKLQRELGDVVHTLRFIKSRERGNLDKLGAISSWVFWVSAAEVVLILGMSAAQIAILRTFFARPPSKAGF